MISPDRMNALLPLKWLRRHFARYQSLRPWQFCWRVTVEALVLTTVAAATFYFFNTPGIANSSAIANMPFWLAVLFLVAASPLWETFVFQAMPIAFASFFRARFWLQVCISTALYVLANYLTGGLVPGICSGLIGGFYLSFCFATWWPRSARNAVWITGLSHAINNAAAIAMIVIFSHGWPGPQNDLAMNYSGGGWADIGTWYFWKPHGDFAFAIVGHCGKIGSMSSYDPWASLVVNGVSSPFEMRIGKTSREVSYDLDNHTLTIAGHTFDLQKANVIYISLRGDQITFDPRMVEINPASFHADRGDGYLFAALTVAFADKARPAFAKDARHAMQDYLQMQRRRRAQAVKTPLAQSRTLPPS